MFWQWRAASSARHARTGVHWSHASYSTRSRRISRCRVVCAPHPSLSCDVVTFGRRLCRHESMSQCCCLPLRAAPSPRDHAAAATTTARARAGARQTSKRTSGRFSRCARGGLARVRAPRCGRSGPHTGRRRRCDRRDYPQPRCRPRGAVEHRRADLRHDLQGAVAAAVAAGLGEVRRSSSFCSSCGWSSRRDQRAHVPFLMLFLPIFNDGHGALSIITSRGAPEFKHLLGKENCRRRIHHHRRGRERR